jgi:DNA-binding IclR family transcriptional regulator
LPAHTPHTLTAFADLERDLAHWAEKGFVVAKNDYFDGLCAIGAPIWVDQGACVGCMFVNGRSADMPDADIDALGMELKSTTDLFSLGTPSIQTVARMFGTRPSSAFPRIRHMR